MVSWELALSLALAPAAGGLAVHAAAHCTRTCDPAVPLQTLKRVALAGALAIPVAAAALAPPAAMPLVVLLGWVLVALAVMDLRAFVLADVVTLPLIALGFGLAWATGRPLIEPALGAAAGAALLAGPMLAYRVWRGRDGLGLGDVKLMAAAGAWAGASALPGILLIAAIATAVAALALHRGRADAAVPFGPGLALGFWLAVTAGPLQIA